MKYKNFSKKKTLKTFINFRLTTPLHYAKERWCDYLKPHSKLNTQKILEEYGYEPEYDFETIDDKIEEILRDFTEENGIGSNGYEELKEIVGLDYMYTYIYPEDIGKVDTGIIDLYLFAFELAIKQLEERA